MWAPAEAPLLTSMHAACPVSVFGGNQWISNGVPVSAAAALRHLCPHDASLVVSFKVEIALVFAAPVLDDLQGIFRVNLAEAHRSEPALSDVSLEESVQPSSSNPSCLLLQVLEQRS